MAKSRGVFDSKTIKLNLDHLINRKGKPLSDSVDYRIPPELANKFKDAGGRPRHQVDPNQTTTLAQPALASMLYMDVGLWAGDGPSEDSTDASWARRRDFGLVCGRLAVLCSYRHGDKREANADAVASNILTSGGWKRVQPLLDHLSTRPDLGRVVVTKALLGRSDLAQAPTEDKIHVFLGDLHSPLMTKQDHTYAGVEPHQAEYMIPQASPVPSAGPRIPIKTKEASKHPMKGRYNPGLVVRLLLPSIANLLKVSVDDLNNGSTRKYLTLPLLIDNWEEILAILGAVWAETSLDGWDDPQQEEAAMVEEWFETYHGRKGGKGAEIFQSAGEDLKNWLELLVDYQRAGMSPPIRLAQLGDLFDLWMGLKCAFTDAGAWNFCPGAREFAEFWRHQTEYETNQSPTIHMLLHFDDWLTGSQKVKPVFLYGNHDNYMGTLFGLPEQFRDVGIVAQHGHQADDFNKNSGAKIGYLLTQAAFAVQAVRLLEDPMSALVAGVKHGIGPRLTFTEMALEECVFKPIIDGKKPAMTFVMGHTHEPVLQEIRVLEYVPANPPASPPPPSTPVPAPTQHHKVEVTVRFLQLDVVNDGQWVGGTRWWCAGTVRQWSAQQTGVPRADVDLFGSQPVKNRDVVSLSGQQASLVIEVDAGLVVEANVGGDGSEPEGVSVAIGAMTWGGVRTIECKGKHHGYKLTFELLWGNVLP